MNRYNLWGKPPKKILWCRTCNKKIYLRKLRKNKSWMTAIVVVVMRVFPIKMILRGTNLYILGLKHFNKMIKTIWKTVIQKTT